MIGESFGGGRGKGWFSDCVKNDFEPKTLLVVNVQLYSRLEFGKTCAVTRRGSHLS